MRKYYPVVIIYASLLGISPAFAQYDTLWTRTYGGVGDDRINDIETALVPAYLDPGHIMVGQTSSFGPGDMNDGISLVRVAQFPEKLGEFLQVVGPGVVSGKPLALLIINQPVEELERFDIPFGYFHTNVRLY